MNFDQANQQVRALRAEGVDAVAVECIPWGENAKRYCLVFKSRRELQQFRDFNKDWGIKITELAG